MDARGVAARIHDLPTLNRRALIGVVLLFAVGLAWLSLEVRSPDAPLALWWSAIGAVVVGVLASRGRRLAVSGVAVVAITMGNVLGGLPLELSIAYGFANAIEAWIVVRLLTGGRAHAQLFTLQHLGRFMLSVLAGVVAFSPLAAISATVLVGADPWVVGSYVLTSHSSGLLVMVPLFLVPLTVPLRVPAVEPIVQSLALLLLTVIVFAFAGALALTFLIVTTLMWGAFRLPPLLVAIQTVLLAIAAALSTAAGLGQFALLLESNPRGAVFALQLFIMTHAAAGLFVSAQTAEWRKVVDALGARERDAHVVAEGLRQLNAQKDDFISAVSHELRTPVTSILGFSEQLVDTNPDPDSAQAGRIIYRNARRLADVIEDVLELSRLSTTQGSNRPPADVEMQGLLLACIDDTVGLVPVDRRVTVGLVAPQHPVIIRAVEPDLTRIVSNLLTNALKFSPPEGSVTVTLTELDATSIEVSIADEGPGIPVAEQEAVWERFYRVQSVRHRDVPGTGLGLPIVRALVENRVGGEVSLSSDGERGATVVVRIPRTPPVLTQSNSAGVTAP